MILLERSNARAKRSGSAAAMCSASSFVLTMMFIAEITFSSCFCCGGNSVGMSEIAPDTHASAQRPHPVHFETSMMLFSVSAAPVGQT